MTDRRAVWNAVALVATLGLAVVVAVVAVTRSELKAPAPSPSASAPQLPTATPSAGGLNGTGPYIVYATGAGVFAYDVSSGERISLGSLDGAPITERSRQPGGGRVVAFPTGDGSVWSVTRRGMQRVGAIPPQDGERFEGAVVSPDDDTLAVGALSPDAALVLVDLSSGRSTLVPRKPRGHYPPEPLLPVAWSLGGTVVYQVPYCQCGAGSLGLYTLDTNTGASSVVSGTRSTLFFRFVVSASAQSLFYGTGTSRRCASGESTPCEGPPFFLRDLAAGRRGATVLKRASDASFIPAAISQDGGLLLVERVDPSTGATRIELYADDGSVQPPIRGIPKGALPLGLLPRDVVVAASPEGKFALYMIRGGRAILLADQSPATDPAPVYLGWLR